MGSPEPREVAQHDLDDADVVAAAAADLYFLR